MVVYPRLDPALQKQWNGALTDKRNGDLTEKGYYKELEHIFTLAGLLLPSSIKTSLMDKAKEESGSFQNCNTKLEEANMRIIELEEEIRIKEEVIMELQEGKREL
ncbi:uncharacterized protein LOC135212894 [Macrobrachium nipponense]|uniref:uncharacterized protein LOC135212894 n=1 Tax=Macrobrachium nipponense TaxID=159736 RepID=UPI0030C8B026